MSVQWTIGMASYNNFPEVYFTIQSLRLHHDMREKEIVVVDNFGDSLLEKFCRERGEGLIRYERYTTVHGTAAPRNRVFEVARGEIVLCIDSHVLLSPGFFDVAPDTKDLYQGPCISNRFNKIGKEWLPLWRNNMWGLWNYVTPEEIPAEIYEIWGMGLGIFFCKREAWLGFNRDFRGFGGEEGYVHEKYRRAGRKVLCDPSKKWVHFFGTQGRKVPYSVRMLDRVRNYILGFEEIGLDTAPIKVHFGDRLFNEAKNGIKINNAA